MTNPKETEKIKIYSVIGGNAMDQTELRNCYFQMFGNPGNYHFYDHSGEHIQTAPGLLTGATRNFRFIYGGVLWSIRNFVLNTTAPISYANGSWFNERVSPETDEGEFQAQAGGGAEETASTATA